MKLRPKKELAGRILDIGGGGEGIMGRLYGGQVIAIDSSAQELAEAPGGFEKRVMDAEALAFEAATFDHVTFFYSLMYMARETQAKAVAEAARVLRPGGEMHLWDREIEPTEAPPYLAELDIELAGRSIHTTYGIIKPEPRQDAAGFAAMARAWGLRLAERREEAGHFYLRFVKPQKGEAGGQF